MMVEIYNLEAHIKILWDIFAVITKMITKAIIFVIFLYTLITVYIYGGFTFITVVLVHLKKQSSVEVHY